MLKNHFKIAARNLKKQKGYAFINVIGLAIGIAACLLIMLYMQDELSYDRHHEHADRIYRVILKGRLSSGDINFATTPAPLGETLVRGFPEVVAATRFRGRISNISLHYEDRSFVEDGFTYADSTAFDVFTLRLLQGDPERALTEPNTLVLAASIARKYFGDENPVGKTLTLADTDFRVSGVMEDMPRTAHFRFNGLLSMATLEESRSPVWVSNNFYTYLLLQEGRAPGVLEGKFPEIVRKYVGPQIQQAAGLSFEEFLATGGRFGYFLQPLTDIHLQSDLEFEWAPNGNVAYLYTLSAIAVFILLLACINFMNLATARSASRAGEVGVRKVLGSQRRQLVLQFLGESVLTSLLGLLLAIGLVEVLLPAFNGLTGKELALAHFGRGYVVPGLLGLALFVGLLAGSYPAFYLASFRPAVVLKGTGMAGEGGPSALRSGLVVFQFAISIALIVGTGAVYQQLHFMRNKQLGFDKEHVVSIERAWTLGPQAEAFRQTVLDHPDVVSASLNGNVPGRPFDNTTFRREGGPSDEGYSMWYLYADPDYAETLGLGLAAGRYFSNDVATDSTAAVINEAAARRLGWNEPVGQRLVLLDPDPANHRAFTVIGVVKDYHFESLHQEIRPLVLFRAAPYGGSPLLVTVRIRPGHPAQALAALKDTWRAFTPEAPFQYAFLDQDFDALYAAEQRLGTVFGYFTGLAVLIACLGLFGLAAYTAERRTKEIGVRKVLGASVPQVVLLLTKDFARLVLLAFFVATPVAYLAMQQWLADFAYRVEISPGIFLLAGSLALAVAWLTVGFQAVRAALTDPVESLRYE